MTVFRCRECGTVHDSFQALADCCDPLSGGDDDDQGAALALVADGGRIDVDDVDDDGLVGKLIPDGGTRSRRAERESDQGQSSLREHVRSSDTLAGVADQDDECENGTVACPGPDPDADVWPCFECFLAGVDDVEDADDFLADRSPRSLLEEEEGSA